MTASYLPEITFQFHHLGNRFSFLSQFMMITACSDHCTVQRNLENLSCANTFRHAGFLYHVNNKCCFWLRNAFKIAPNCLQISIHCSPSTAWIWCLIFLWTWALNYYEPKRILSILTFPGYKWRFRLRLWVISDYRQFPSSISTETDKGLHDIFTNFVFIPHLHMWCFAFVAILFLTFPAAKVTSLVPVNFFYSRWSWITVYITCRRSFLPEVHRCNTGLLQVIKHFTAGITEDVFKDTFCEIYKVVGFLMSLFLCLLTFCKIMVVV